MNTLFLLVLGATLLLMGQRFLGRLLRVLLFRPTRVSSGEENLIDKPGFCSRIHDFSASAGLLSIFGISLALTWGWAPVYVWIICGATLLTILFRVGIGWLRATVPGARRQPLPISPVGGEVIGRILHTIYIVILVLLMPVACLAIATLIAQFPMALVPLILHVALSVAFRKLINSGGVRIQLLLLAGAAVALPASITLKDIWLSDSSWSNAEVLTDPQSIGILLVLLSVLWQRYKSNRTEQSFAFFSSSALAVLILLVSVLLLLEHPETGYLDYFRETGGPGAMPLIMACMSLGVVALLPVLNENGTAGGSSPLHSETSIEGVFALLVMLVFVAMPSLFPQDPIVLPDWNTGLDPGATVQYLVISIARLGQHLPFTQAGLSAYASYVLICLGWILLNQGIETMRQLGTPLLPKAIQTPVRLDLFIIFTLCGILLAYGFGSVPVSLWITTGLLSLLFGSGILSILAFALYRLGRPSGACTGSALLLGLIFWWCLVERLAHWIGSGHWTWTMAGLAIGLTGGVVSTLAVSSFIVLHRSRKRSQAN